MTAPGDNFDAPTATKPTETKRIGLIAGNGSFPLLVLDAARAQGFEVIVAAIKEEASPEIEAARRGGRTLALAGRVVQVD